MGNEIHSFLAEVIGGPDDFFLKGHSNSMSPSIRPGELIRITPVDQSRLRSGDVVVFRAGRSFIVHRLVWKKNFVAVTKGDNNAFCDRQISVFDIVGIVDGKSSRRALWYYFFRNRIRHYTPMPLKNLAVILKKIVRIFRSKYL